MAELVVKNVAIGTGRPKTIVSLMDIHEIALLETADRAVKEGAELLEWRADFFGEAQDGTALAKTCRALMNALPATPLIFTLRTKGQGGQLELSADDYAELVRTVIEQGVPDFVDVELGIGDEAVRALVDVAHVQGVRVIISEHDFHATPDIPTMKAILLHMVELGADIPKIAVMPTCAADPRHLMRATAQVRDEVDVPLLTMAMGLSGQHTRLSGEVFGSSLTFCALGKASAPGQVELSEAISLMDALHQQVSGQ